MSNRLAFQTQLASIMEVLANAAVAEICKLVDDDYAVVSLQMSQCQRENKALKRKLNLLELKMARGYAERRLRESALNSRPKVHINTNSDRFRGISPGVFDKSVDVSLWSKASSVHQANNPIRNERIQEESSDVQLVERQPLMVKEEIMEEGLLEHMEDDDVPLIGEDGVVECGPRRRTSSQQDVQAAMSHASGLQSPSQPRSQSQGLQTRQRIGGGRGVEVSGSSPLLKSENDASVDGRDCSLHTPPLGPQTLARRYADSQQFSVFGDDESASSLVGEFFNEAESEAGRPSCSYAAGDGVAPSFRSECQSQGPLPGSDVTAKQEVIDIDSEEGEERLGFWDGDTISEESITLGTQGNNMSRHPSHSLQSSSHDMTLPSSASALNGWSRSASDNFPVSQPGGAKAKALHRTSAREKLFECSYCGKAFNRPKKVEIHQRIHTGEKPFRCSTCGKMFSEAGNLKKHQRVHTGEKPFYCELCGKGFAWIRNLKTHQQRHHPDVYTEDMDLQQHN